MAAHFMRNLRRFVLPAAAALAGCQAPPQQPVRPSDLLNATVWQQRSVEYEATVQSLYRAALDRLQQALVDCSPTRPAGCAPVALEQRGLTPAQLAALPPAVVMDLDETALDNSAFEAAVQLRGEDFSEGLWARWIAASAAEAARPAPRYRTALPGASPFTAEAARLGVAVFYVSNRSCPTAERAGCAALRHTQALMQLQSPPFARAGDAAAFHFMVDGQSSDKTARRQAIAATHRIVLLIGDDLGDFVGREARDALRRGTDPAVAAFAQQHWGRHWFMLPNAMYGSWEYFLTQGSRCPSARELPDAVARGRECRQGRIEAKERQLTTFETTLP